MAQFALTIYCDGHEFCPEVLGGWRREVREALMRLAVELDKPVSSGAIRNNYGAIGSWKYEPDKPKVAA
jgi:hypothetical protein